MKPTELRIGSWYMSTKWGKPVPLTAEDIHEMVCRAEGANISHCIEEIVQPIPLTLERIKMLGVVRKDSGLYSPNGCWHEYEWHAHGDSEYGTLSLQSGKMVVLARLKKVHEFQNLHFGLTGEELKYDPTN